MGPRPENLQVFTALAVEDDTAWVGTAKDCVLVVGRDGRVTRAVSQILLDFDFVEFQCFSQVVVACVDSEVSVQGFN